MTFWQQLLHNLAAHGMSQAQIAADAGSNQSTLSSIQCGKSADPRYSLGHALVLLAKRKRCLPKAGGAAVTVEGSAHE